MKMGDSSIEDHIAQFKVLLTKANISEESPSAFDYFRKTLNFCLQKKLIDLAEPPKDLEDWYKWTIQLDNNYRKIQRVLQRERETGRMPDKRKDEPKRRWTFPKREKDPNTMDVNTITTEQREEMMMKGSALDAIASTSTPLVNM